MTSADDELAVRGLVARYCDAVCRRDREAWAATWAVDCTWDLGGGRVVHGRQAALDLWTSALTKYPWVELSRLSRRGAVRGPASYLRSRRVARERAAAH